MQSAAARDLERAAADDGPRLAGLEVPLRGQRRREAGLLPQERALAEELRLRRRAGGHARPGSGKHSSRELQRLSQAAGSQHGRVSAVVGGARAATHGGDGRGDRRRAPGGGDPSGAPQPAGSATASATTPVSRWSARCLWCLGVESRGVSSASSSRAAAAPGCAPPVSTHGAPRGAYARRGPPNVKT